MTSIRNRRITKQKTFGIGGVGRKPIAGTTSYRTSPSSSKDFFWQEGEATKVLGGKFGHGL
jgi:hypothetical protein